MPGRLRYRALNAPKYALLSVLVVLAAACPSENRGSLSSGTGGSSSPRSKGTAGASSPASGSAKDAGANDADGSAGSAADGSECEPSCKVIVGCDPKAGTLDQCIAACMDGLNVGKNTGPACLDGYRAQNSCVEALDCTAYSSYAAQSPAANYPCKAERDQLVRGCNPPKVDTKNRVTMKLAGMPWSSISADVSGWPPSGFTITASDTQDPGRALILRFMMGVTGPGSYSISGSTWSGSGQAKDLFVIPGDVATVEISSLASDRLAGTFKLTLKNPVGDSLEITDGTIDVGPGGH